MIVSYSGRADDGGVGRKALIGQRKNNNGLLDGEIVEVRYGVFKKIKYEVAI